MIYLDTHVVLWLYTVKGEGLSKRARRLIEASPALLISPMVLLELAFLYEIGRIRVEAMPIYDYLKEKIGLESCAKPFSEIIRMATQNRWTRDPFDRIITAQAAIGSSTLITKDQQIRRYYPYAEW